MHSQWRQQSGSAHLTGAWIHVVDVREAYELSFLGIVRISSPQFKLGLRTAKQGHYLRDALEYQNAEKHGGTVEPLEPKEATSSSSNKIRNARLCDV